MKVYVEFNDALEETQVHIEAKEAKEEVQSLIAWIKNKEKTADILLGYDKENVIPIEKESVYYFHASAKKVYVHSKKGIFEVKKRLYELEVWDKDFLRISNSEIVRIQEIEKINLKYSGTIMLCMKNKDELYVSRRYMPKVRIAFGLGGSQ